MTNQTNKPTEPGFYFERTSGRRFLICRQHEFRGESLHCVELLSDGFALWGSVDSLPPGNWHKLTAPATNAEARDKFHGWLKGHRSQSYDEQIADKAAEIFAGVQRDADEPPEGFTECDTCRAKPGTPYLCSGCLKNRYLISELRKEVETRAACRDEITTLKATVAKLEEQVATEHAKYINSERAATVALQAQTILKQADEIAELKRDPSPSLWEAGKKFREWLVDWGAKEWPTNDRIAKQALKIFSEVVPPKEQPEVIVGEGQAVTEEQAGWYAFDDPYGTSATEKTHNGEEGTGEFAMGSRYIKLVLPTFPPRKPAFVAPPKPERLIRWKDSGEIEWLIEEDYRKAIEIVELIDEKTGEPIKEQA